jgi:HPt (histidine-containing phosphotransfer) domain-containing protein
VRARLLALGRFWGKFRTMVSDGTTMMDDAAQAPLRSRFSDDPEMRALVVWFLEDLGRRVGAIRAAIDLHDAASLRVLAHQLAGSAGGYGFDSIGRAAQELEEEIKSVAKERTANGVSVGIGAALADELEREGRLSALTEKAEDLIALCRRAIDANGAAS